MIRDCRHQANPPTANIFQPVLPITFLLTLKQIPMIAAVRNKFAAFRPRNSPLPVAIGEMIQLGKAMNVFKRITRKKPTINRGKELNTLAYFELAALSLAVALFPSRNMRTKITGTNKPIRMDFTHNAISKEELPPPWRAAATSCGKSSVVPPVQIP